MMPKGLDQVLKEWGGSKVYQYKKRKSCVMTVSLIDATCLDVLYFKFLCSSNLKLSYTVRNYSLLSSCPTIVLFTFSCNS
ncbi:hypothetical protein WN944_029216 [Citrus x changshan-huyou]|uniref:Uncharacterized protein n=2 Tax=Citrus TaxID=2706 RepID=V4RQI7_CITCL|nr:hypothetical protein CICLE_v10030428mg [Citrus x clementina]